jgi:hypothetical protein
MEKIIKEYIIKLLQLQKTKLKYINLGYNLDKMTNVEIDLIDKAIKYIKGGGGDVK